MTKKILVFVGSLVPDEQRFVTRAFSPAANLFQGQLLRSVLDTSHFDNCIVWTVIATPGSRRGGPWLVKSEDLSVALGVDFARSFWMINVTPIKQLWLGLAIGFRLLALRFKSGWSANITVLQYNTLIPPLAFTWFAARLIGARIFVSANDIGAPVAQERNAPLRRVEAAQDRILLPRVDGLLVVTESIAKDFNIPSNRVLIVDAGVPDSFPELKSRDAKRCGSEQVTIGYAGALEPHNGVMVLLGALERSRELPVRVLIAGRGSCIDAVRKAAELDARIEYLGFLSRNEVFAMYERCDALLNLRMIDSHDMRYFFPSKLIECLATGLPVISTPVAHATAEFGDTMFVVPTEKVDSLASTLRLVVATDAAHRLAMGLAARARVMATRRWSTIGRRVVALMETASRSS